MNSSLPVACGIGAVAQFSRQVQTPGRRAFPRDFRLSGAAGLARTRRQNDSCDDGFGDADVVIQPMLERGPDDSVQRRGHFRIVEPVLGLSLKLRFLDEDAQHAGQPLADVLGDKGDAFRR